MPALLSVSRVSFAVVCAGASRKLGILSFSYVVCLKIPNFSHATPCSSQSWSLSLVTAVLPWKTSPISVVRMDSLRILRHAERNRRRRPLGQGERRGMLVLIYFWKSIQMMHLVRVIRRRALLARSCGPEKKTRTRSTCHTVNVCCTRMLGKLLSAMLPVK